jgi:hypothetical protein
VLSTLVLGIICTYGLLRLVGLVGAAIADDLVAFAYVLANLWICTRFLTLDIRALALSVGRILLAAGAMAVDLLIVGTDHLSPAQWVVGGAAGIVSYFAILIVNGELTHTELRTATAKLLSGARQLASPG